MAKYAGARFCPLCRGKTKIFDSRPSETGEVIRYRKCLNCGSCFITIETFSRFWKKPGNNKES